MEVIKLYDLSGLYDQPDCLNFGRKRT